MQTRQQVKQKVQELQRDLATSINDRVERLLCSGAIDLEAFDDDFRVAKVVYRQVLMEIAEEYRPFSVDLQELAKNLKNF